MSYVKQKRAKEQIARVTTTMPPTPQSVSHSFTFKAKPVTQRVTNDTTLAISEIGTDLKKTLITTLVLLGLQIALAKYLEAGAWTQILKTLGAWGI